jgi:hypothetical protein
VGRIHLVQGNVLRQSSEHSNKPSGCKKGEQFLDQLLKKGFAPGRLVTKVPITVFLNVVI